MGAQDLSADGVNAVQKVLGYLNFSSGATDPAFFASLDAVFSHVTSLDDADQEVTGDTSRVANWQLATDFLLDQLDDLEKNSPTFSNSEQARRLLTLLPDVVRGYRHFHADLLQHQSDDFLFNAFTFGRICEVVLKHPPDVTRELQSESEHDSPSISATDSDQNAAWVETVIKALSDYVGHRPVATLQAHQHEPYEHEWVRPVPLYIQGAGTVAGRYHDVIEKAVEILRQTDEELLRAAWFDPGELEELAVDPRSYDFEHPANKRPNYHFGQWDPHCIDNRGYYRRFVIRQVTIDGLLSRVDASDTDGDAAKALFEAAAVLAGTILMASGVSGDGPDTHDSNTTLVSLVPRIATYRDRFYERLIEQVDGDHAVRLEEEAARRLQPFGGARQHLNGCLAKRRARQLAHVRLARVFARMGYSDAAMRQAKQVPVTSARLLCRIDCHLTAAHQALDRQDLALAGDGITTVHDLLHRGIRCGAIVDPWNILGFDGNFSLFPALEDSIHDHRIDDLLVIVQRLLELYSRFWSEAAATNALESSAPIIEQFREFAEWWHQFAAHEVSSVDAVSAHAAYDAASKVASALAQWNQQGAAAGDVGFWAPHVQNFDAPSAYGLVVETLLQKRDLESSMSLLVYWLSQAPRIRLESAECSFCQQTQRWLGMIMQVLLSEEADGLDDDRRVGWQLVRKFMDYLEANAGEYWETPEFLLDDGNAASHGVVRDDQQTDQAQGDLIGHDRESDMDDDEEDLFGAAYEGVVYKDSTDDGVDGSLFETGGGASNDALMIESDRLVDRLSFLENLAHLWLRASLGFAAAYRNGGSIHMTATGEAIASWRSRAAHLRNGLLDLGRVIERYRLPVPGNDYDSLVEFDRQRFFRESLLENTMIASVALAESEQIMEATELSLDSERMMHVVDELASDSWSDDDSLQQNATFVLACLLAGETDLASEQIEAVCDAMSGLEILYVPLSKGGRIGTITKARARQRLIENLVIWLPRHGLIEESLDVLETARSMERDSPVGPGAITQFDELFEAASRQIIECLVAAANNTPDETSKALVRHVEFWTEELLAIWLQHSKTLRLSPLERVRKEKKWNDLVTFIGRFGGDLFSQQFFTFGNIRAILHVGVESWLDGLADLPHPPALAEAAENANTRRRAVEHMTLILEAISENYDEYRDYNSTTTQSDRGELLYTLLDFLRLRTAYDRVTWNLRPILFAHEILVRRGKNEAAQIWRRGLTQKIGSEADSYVERLSELQAKYAMRLPSVTDRLSERFVRPMTVDRMRALVEPALEHASDAETCHAFELLEDESNLLMKEPAGSGLDIPGWLAALEDEVEQGVRLRKLGVIDDIEWLVPREKITLDDFKL